MIGFIRRIEGSFHYDSPFGFLLNDGKQPCILTFPFREHGGEILLHKAVISRNKMVGSYQPKEDPVAVGLAADAAGSIKKTEA